MYKQCENKIIVTRKIPLDKKKYLYTIDETTNLTIEQRLLDFCKEPKTMAEIKDFLGESAQRVRKVFTNPLILQNKLKFTIPDQPAHTMQRYVNAKVEIAPEMQAELRQKPKSKETIEMQQLVLRFCVGPRSIREIMALLNIPDSASAKYRFVKPLMRAGKLAFKYPDNPYSSKQQYITIDTE